MCTSHITAAWHFAGVTNLSQDQGGVGDSFLNFGQFSVLYCALWFSLDLLPALRMMHRGTVPDWSEVQQCFAELAGGFPFFLWRRKGGGSVFCWFCVLKWLSSGRCQGQCREMGRKVNLWHLAVGSACFAALPQLEQFENKQ